MNDHRTQPDWARSTKGILMCAFLSAGLVGLAGCASTTNSPVPASSGTSEPTPTPSASAETFDATKLDIPANATDQQIGDGYAAVVTAELTGSLDGNNPAKTFNLMSTLLRAKKTSH